MTISSDCQRLRSQRTAFSTSRHVGHSAEHMTLHTRIMHLLRTYAGRYAASPASSSRNLLSPSGRVPSPMSNLSGRLSDGQQTKMQPLSKARRHDSKQPHARGDDVHTVLGRVSSEKNDQAGYKVSQHTILDLDDSVAQCQHSRAALDQSFQGRSTGDSQKRARSSEYDSIRRSHVSLAFGQCS